MIEMNEQLYEIMIKQKITLFGIMIFMIILLVVVMVWIYAEFAFYKNGKLVQIEIARDKMDGVEFGRRSSVVMHHKSILKAPSRVIKMSKLDQAPVSHASVAYSKIKVNNRVQFDV